MTPWVLDATGCMSSFKFVIPAIPQARPALPVGDRWIHEPKLDGWRLQAHKFGSRVVLFTRSGIDCSLRFPTVVGAVASLPAASAVLDGELVVVGPDGLPDFRAMHRGQAGGLQFFASISCTLTGPTAAKSRPAIAAYFSRRNSSSMAALWSASWRPSPTVRSCSTHARQWAWRGWSRSATTPHIDRAPAAGGSRSKKRSAMPLLTLTACAPRPISAVDHIGNCSAARRGEHCSAGKSMMAAIRS